MRTVEATKTPLGPDEALRLARRATKVVVSRGARVITLDMKKAPVPTDEELLGVLLGPTGKLRAPTLQVGDTLLVGFGEDAYRSVLG